MKFARFGARDVVSDKFTAVGKLCDLRHRQCRWTDGEEVAPPLAERLCGGSDVLARAVIVSTRG